MPFIRGTIVKFEVRPRRTRTLETHERAVVGWLSACSLFDLEQRSSRWSAGRRTSSPAHLMIRDGAYLVALCGLWRELAPIRGRRGIGAGMVQGRPANTCNECVAALELTSALPAVSESPAARDRARLALEPAGR